MSDALTTALGNGLTLEEIQSYLRKGLQLEEIAAASQALQLRGELRPAGDGPRVPLNLERFTQALEELGVTVRHNLITKETELTGLPARFNPEALRADAPVILHDMLKDRFRCSKELVADLLSLTAGLHRYNPVLEWLDGLVWDGQDRLLQLFRILHLDEEDQLSMTLVQKWCWQCVAMAKNELEGAYGADGILVLQGPQGIGKTTFARIMAAKPQFFKAGQYIDTRDKDTSRRCVTAWVSELGELETTLRSDLERLKAFITAERDEYRLPYARCDTVSARRTSLIATCNSAEFLIDPTGSRRFWTVPVEQIDLAALARFDVGQFWAQMRMIVEEEGAQCFRLSAAEQALLAKRNASHEKPVKAQREVEDILSSAEERRQHYEWRYATVTEFKAENPALTRYSANQIGHALDRVGIRMERRCVNRRQIKARRLPMRRFNSSISTFANAE